MIIFGFSKPHKNNSGSSSDNKKTCDFFINWRKLTTIDDSVFPDVTRISHSMFAKATLDEEDVNKAENISLSKVTEIMPSAFAQNQSIKKVSFPNVEKIWYGAFDSCYNLQEVYMPKLKELQWGTIEHYSWNGYFSNCIDLQKVEMPLIPMIDENMFCSTLLQDISFPEVMQIGCTGLSATNVINITNNEFPKITKLGPYAFSECANLTYVDLETITDISL